MSGAHSLGRCRKDQSGFEGQWDNTPQTLDNAYYQSMIGTIWRAKLASNG